MYFLLLCCVLLVETMPGKKIHTIKAQGVSKKRKRELARQKNQARWAKKEIESSQQSPVLEVENPIPGTSRDSESNSELSACNNNNKLRLNALADIVESNNISDEPESSQQYVIIDLKCLEALLYKISCTECGKTSLTFQSSDHQGFACKIAIFCTTCGNITSTMSSGRVANDSSTRAPFDINRRMVQAFTTFGRGHSAIQQFSSVMNIKPISQYSYQEHLKTLHGASTSVAEQSLQQIRAEVRRANRDDKPNGGDDDVVDIAVSFDGSWHKRGHTSNYGIGCVIDVLTGYVIDYEVMSKLCRVCEQAKRDLGVGSPEFAIWEEGHISGCQKNYEGSSGGMEAIAAERLWKRSLLYGLRYTTLLSDGDSKTFSHLQSLNVYGSTQIQKEECVNHVSKRLGTGLREVAKKFKLGGKKYGSLTNVTIQKLTRYYGNAIRSNSHDLKAMKNAVLATLHHCASTDAKPLHHRCPSGSDSWCFHKRAEALNKPSGSHQQHLHTPLSTEVIAKIVPVYERLASYALLERCLRGQTQNSNESLHSVIWRKCPKDSSVSKRKIDLAVAAEVGEFNSGFAITMKRMLEQSGISPGREGTKIAHARDKKRVERRHVRANDKFQHYRRTVKLAKIRNEAAHKEREGCSYAPGGF